MEEKLVNQAPQQIQPQNIKAPDPNDKGKSLSKKFIFGIVIFSLFIITLSVLNYFNILPLSKILPNYLGFLPHKIQTDKFIPQQLPTGISPVPFPYDMELAKTILSKYIKDNIKPEFIPPTLDVKQGLSIDNTIDENQKNLFGTLLNNKNETISITFHFIENIILPNDFKIFIHPSKTEQTTLNVDLANSLVSSYFINPFPIEKCNTFKTTTFCKDIKTEAQGKREYGVIMGIDNSKTPTISSSTIFSCFIPKENPYYDHIKSCVSP